MIYRRITLKVAALALCLILASCATSQIALALNVASLAVNVASKVLPSIPGITFTTDAQVAAYLSAVSKALGEAGADMNSGEITSLQIAQISTELAAAVIPNLPVGTNPILASALQAVVSGVNSFLALLQQQSTMMAPPAVGGARPAPLLLHLSYRDRSLVKQANQFLLDANGNLAARRIR